MLFFGIILSRFPMSKKQKRPLDVEDEDDDDMRPMGEGDIDLSWYV